jgi:ABC-type Fe2+-enterobactin transport system substrate-binding protein
MTNSGKVRLTITAFVRTAVLASALCSLGAAWASAQSQYPIMDRIAAKVVEKYQNSSCQQLAAERGQPPSGQRAQMEQRAIQMLRQNPQMREAFINRVVAPIANKMFECGMIP